MDNKICVAVCTDSYQGRVEWACAFPNGLEDAKSYVSNDWKRVLEEKNLDPSDYSEDMMYDVRPAGDRYVALIYDGNDFEMYWEILQAEVHGNAPSASSEKTPATS